MKLRNYPPGHPSRYEPLSKTCARPATCRSHRWPGTFSSIPLPASSSPPTPLLRSHCSFPPPPLRIIYGETPHFHLNSLSLSLLHFASEFLSLSSRTSGAGDSFRFRHGFFLLRAGAEVRVRRRRRRRRGGVGGGGGDQQLLLYRGLKKAKKERGCTAKERISKMPPCAAGKRSSIYRGVTRHRWTGRYEAHLWDKSTWNQNQNKKGKQVYLGAYDDEEAAARAYDLAALKYWGPGTLINFPVKDYARDLEEMQNVSREDYLVSLRRKSSGFSRGVSKYRGLSSRWESSFSRIGGAEYFNSIYGAGEDPAIESDFGGSFCIDRKIDLTGYIKWWGQNKTRQLDLATKSSEEVKHCSSDDINTELKTSEWEATEPYQMPRLGVPRDGRRHKGSTLSALGVLSQSAAYKSLQEKALKKQEKDHDNDDENKNTINRMDYGQPVEKSRSHEASEKQGVTVGVSGTPPPQRNVYPLTSFLNAPLLTNYSSIDPMADPVLWSSLVPGLPAGLSRTAEVPKTETSSTYTFVQPQE